jgi:ABC-type arginine/histidine transport system permease subunit
MVVALALLFVSDVATMIAIMLKLEGFGRDAWLMMALVAIVCSFTSTWLMVQHMLSNRTPQKLGDWP